MITDRIRPFRQVSYLQQRSCTHPTQPTPTKPKSMPIPIPVQNQQRQPHRTTMSDIQITVHSLSTSQPEPTPPPSLDTQSDPGPRGVNMSGSPHNTQERQTLLDELAAKYSIKSNTVPFAKLQLKRRLSDGLSIPQVFEATYDSTSVAVKYYELNRKTTAQTVRKGMLGEAAIMRYFTTFCPSRVYIIKNLIWWQLFSFQSQNCPAYWFHRRARPKKSKLFGWDCVCTCHEVSRRLFSRHKGPGDNYFTR